MHPILLRQDSGPSGSAANSIQPNEHPLLVNYAYKEGDPEPHKGIPASELDGKATLEALGWYTSPFQKERGRNQYSSIPDEDLSVLWNKRWHTLRRIYSLRRRLSEHWRDAQKDAKKKNEPFPFLSHTQGYKNSKPLLYNMLRNIQKMKETYKEKNMKPPEIEKSIEIEEYREDFKAWVMSSLQSKRCQNRNKDPPGMCLLECKCPDILEYILD